MKMQRVLVLMAMLATAAAALYCVLFRRRMAAKPMVETFIQK